MITILLFVASALGLSYLATAGLLWVLFWLLDLLGVALPIAWSCGTSAIIWGIILVVKSLFGGIKIDVD